MDSVQRIFSNCQHYHPVDSEEAECGQRLHDYFQGRLDELGLAPKKSGKSRKGKQKVSSSEEAEGEETLPVPEKLLTKTWLAVNDLRECQHGTRQHKAKFSAVHECLLEELCMHPDSAPFLKLPSRRQVGDGDTLEHYLVLSLSLYTSHTHHSPSTLTEAFHPSTLNAAFHSHRCLPPSTLPSTLNAAFHSHRCLPPSMLPSTLNAAFHSHRCLPPSTFPSTLAIALMSLCSPLLAAGATVL